jgi:adenylate kinase
MQEETERIDSTEKANAA